MSPRTLTLQNQIRSTTSGIEYDDTLSLPLAETLVNLAFITDTSQVTGTLVMDLNFLRTAVRDIKGETAFYNWYDESSTLTTSGLMSLSEARREINNLQDFVGSNGDGDATPDYTSTCFIAQNDPLETAISTLDAQLCIATGTISQSNEIQKRVLIRTGGQILENTSINISTPGAGWTVYGDDVQITTSGTFVESTSVYTNGVLQLTAPDGAANNDVYWVSTPYTIAFEYKIRTNDVIQIYKFPSIP
jgi:hypothetical protein